jgi:hypothetical protein
MNVTVATLTRPAKFFPKGYSRLLPNIMMISNIRENGETIGALPDGEMHFHHDQIYSEVPHNGTLLYSLEIPTYGGDTLFASGRRSHRLGQSLLHARPGRFPLGSAPPHAAHNRQGNATAVLTVRNTSSPGPVRRRKRRSHRQCRQKPLYTWDETRCAGRR